MPSSTHRAPGIRQIRPAPTGSAPSANNRRCTILPTGCRMCWEKTARAMPAKPSRCSARDTRPSAPSPISQNSPRKRRKTGRPGCCGATIPQRPLAAAPMAKLAARGELGAAFAARVAAGRIKVERKFRVSDLTVDGPRLIVGAGDGGRKVVVDELIVATGFRPDLDFVRELRIQLDPAIECPVALAPLIDPKEHSCGTVRPHGARELAQPEPGFYFAGMKSYGRAPTFLMLTGYEQVRSIAADIAGDREAAERVELVLPETGVCNRSAASDANKCCGGPAVSAVDACCVADANAKQEGKT